MDSFSKEANTEIALEDAEFTFQASGSNWKIYNKATNTYLTNVTSANTFFSATADDMKVTASTETENAFTICRSTGSRFVIFYNAQMNFNSNGSWSANYAGGSYDMEKQPEVTDKKVFTELGDVYDAEWYAKAVAWAYNNSIVTGDLNTKKFNPNADVTREQLALMMFRYAKFKEFDTSATSDFAGLVNADKVADWSMDGVKWAVGAGLISGIEKDGVKDLAPQGNVSRAQMAAILQRFCENVK